MILIREAVALAAWSFCLGAAFIISLSSPIYLLVLLVCLAGLGFQIAVIRRQIKR